MGTVTDYFGSLVFDDRVMKATLSAKVYASLKKTIDDKRKEIKKIYMQPYEIVDAQTKELIALINEPLAAIDA